MNDVLRPFLHRFVLVFFDDILLFSSSWAEHLCHLHTVLSVMRNHQLFLKQSKCSFGEPTVAYLGHIVSADGVSMDNNKVQAVTEWPKPRSICGLRGFLGLAGYYRRFIKDFGTITAPLTRLLKRGTFQWSLEVDAAFQQLKHALTSAPALELPNFDRPFIVECDASSSKIGAVLHLNTVVSPPMNASSLAWLKLCNIGAHTCGDAHSSSRWISPATQVHPRPVPRYHTTTPLGKQVAGL
jgi:hypothetical protein